VLFLSEDISTPSLCDDTCGYHYYFNQSGIQIKYMFVGTTGTANSCSGCQSPNGPWGVKTNQLVNSFVHELIGTVSDPIPFTGWYDSAGLENSQKCADTFPDSQNFRPDPAKQWNVVVGAGVIPHWFLIQGNWDICSNTCQVVGTVNCAIHAPLKPITSSPHSPSAGYSIQVNLINMLIVALATLALLL